MKSEAVLGLALASLLLLLGLSGCSSGNDDSAGGDDDSAGGDDDDAGDDDDSGGSGTVSLEHLETWEMGIGTHRPEIFLLDSGELLLVVVEHETQGEVQVTHKGYRFDSEFNSLMDPFVVTTETTEYGHPADHRAAVINGELVVVYQTLIVDPQAPKGGPAESSALSQSLLLARFDLQTGAEIDRQPLAAHVTDFSVDSFPDHCLLWRIDRLLVSTGSYTEGPDGHHFRIREVDPFASYPDNVLATHDLDVSNQGLPSDIGNSFFQTPDGGLWMFGSTGPQTAQLQAAPLGDDFSPQTGIPFYDEDIEQSFPTGVVPDGDHIFVGSLYRERGGDQGLELNPYFPRLKVLSSDLSTVLFDAPVGDGSPGSAHIHPTIALGKDRLYFAWSRQSGDVAPIAPQVLIEVYSLQR